VKIEKATTIFNNLSAKYGLEFIILLYSINFGAFGLNQINFALALGNSPSWRLIEKRRITRLMQTMGDDLGEQKGYH
jgi:hypothetical protein